MASMTSPSQVDPHDVFPNFKLPLTPNTPFMKFSEYAQRNHPAPASHVGLLWDTMSVNQRHQFVALSEPQDAEKQIRENLFPPVDIEAKRSTSCPPPPPLPASMPPRDSSKARDDRGLAVYGPPVKEAEAKSFAWAIDPSTAPMLTTGAYRIDTPSWYVGLDSPMDLFDNTFAPTPRKLEELVWM
ncbi:hypothetical protein DFS33DRAFT_1276212 [Desarmillaria ectypa]|nr:hypothetical protein DFS33DRAFT_1276212 [Desarmillaria ectypa]